LLRERMIYGVQRVPVVAPLGRRFQRLVFGIVIMLDLA
jgi:hypothetical protein